MPVLDGKRTWLINTPPSRALVVYESLFGNTQQVAKAVARGMALAGWEVQLVDVMLAATMTSTAISWAGCADPRVRAQVARRPVRTGHGPDAVRDLGCRSRERHHPAEPRAGAAPRR